MESVTGFNGTVGAGITARTAVKARRRINDILTVAFADGTCRAYVGAGTATYTRRSNFIRHEEHLQKIYIFYYSTGSGDCKRNFQKSITNFRGKHGKNGQKASFMKLTY